MQGQYGSVPDRPSGPYNRLSTEEQRGLKEPPGVALKCLCPPCAVVMHEGASNPVSVLASVCCCCLFTLTCWQPQAMLLDKKGKVGSSVAPPAQYNMGAPPGAAVNLANPACKQSLGHAPPALHTEELSAPCPTTLVQDMGAPPPLSSAVQRQSLSQPVQAV